jgi:hypothetical protein
MSLLRFLLVFVIGWLVLRMVRVFMNIKRGGGDQESARGSDSIPSQHRGPDDFAPNNIKDAEFEDLTPSSQKPPTPPPKT